MLSLRKFYVSAVTAQSYYKLIFSQAACGKKDITLYQTFSRRTADIRKRQFSEIAKHRGDVLNFNVTHISQGIVL